MTKKFKVGDKGKIEKKYPGIMFTFQGYCGHADDCDVVFVNADDGSVIYVGYEKEFVKEEE